MLKKIIALIFIMLFTFFYCQVGINTETPHATLEVLGKPNQFSVPDGIMIPKLDKIRLYFKRQAYGEEQKGALIFITEINAGVPDVPSMTNVTSPGFYFFDGELWQKMTPDIPVIENLYKNDGTVGSGRKVAVTDRLDFDDNTLHIDAVNNRIGVGTSTPSNNLDVNGGIRVHSIPIGTTVNNEQNVLFPDPDGNLRAANIREVLGNAGIMVESNPNNVWSNLYIGKSAKLTFVGRYSINAQDITFEIFFDRDGNITILNNTFCTLNLVNGDNSKILLTVGNESVEINFIDKGNNFIDVIAKSGTSFHWLQGTFFIVPNLS